MEFPFKEDDGIHESKSTVSQRIEIIELANKLQLCDGDLKATYNASDYPIVVFDNMVYIGYGYTNKKHETLINHIPFEEFKQRLLDYEKSLTNK